MKRFLLLILLLPTVLFAHNTGNIRGKVTNANNGEPVIGATIRIRNSLIQASSDISGNFALNNLQIGDYEIICASLGYTSSTKQVTVREKQTDTVNFVLEPSVIGLQEVIVEGIRPVSAASTKELRALDMQLKPFRTTQDMLLMAPGLFTAQHQGGGKAEQIFLRGFDSDHGTDVSISVDGMPVNMPSHAHGQGYADLHFVIAETVNEMEVNKGPYLATIGNFYTAGAVTFKTKDVLESNLLKVEAGQFNTQKYTLMFQPESGSAEQNGYLALQYHHSDGPFISPEKFERMNLFSKYFFNLSRNSKLTLSAGGFTTGWNASGQIPDRAVGTGLIDRFGGIDNLEGGITNRKNVNLEYRFQSTRGNEFEMNTYYTGYNFKLYSNFTYYLVDTVNGDMIEQNEHRSIQGVNASYKFNSSLGRLRFINRLGGGYRADLNDVQLWHSPNRIRMNVFTDDVIDEQNFSLWAQQEILTGNKIRIVWGLRHDLFTFSKDDRVGDALDSINNGLTHGSGVAHQSVVSPKFNLIYSPLRNLDIFINMGQGFHSNDARNVVLGAKVKELTSLWRQEGGTTPDQINSRLSGYNLDPAMAHNGTLPKATAGELGIRSKLFDKLHFGMAAWYLYLDKEFVYVGDGGTVELSDPTERMGTDIEARLALKSWIWLDADISAAQGKIRHLPTGENHIPLAPTFVSSGGITIVREQGLCGALRIRHLSDRPANEDNSIVAPGHTLVNANLTYRFKDLELAINGENLLNTTWNEAQFATETRLKGEKESVNELCYTPGNPRNFQFSVSYKF